MARPTFHQDLGEYFKSLRGRRGWSLRQAERIAEEKHLTELSKSQLSAIENGKTKHPGKEVLHAIARLYSEPIEQIVWRVAREVYDVPSSADTSPPSASVTDVTNPLSKVERRALRLLRRASLKGQREALRQLALVADAYPEQPTPRSDVRHVDSAAAIDRKGHGTR